MVAGGRKVRLGPGEEFDRIRRIIPDQALPAFVRVGPGDDAAVIEGGWVLSTDLSTEDVHFRRAWLTDAEIGYRAVVAALSDLAAMAATPCGILVSVAMPDGSDVSWDELQAGIAEAAGAHGAVLLGGDLSRSPGPLMMDVTVLGSATWPVLRDGAEPGDELWVTGRLGAAGAAVHAWESGKEPPPEAREAFARPRPRIEEACCLVDHEHVDAMIDLSDGLAGDAGHLAAASGVKIVLDAQEIPVAAAAIEVLGPEAALDAALHAGEDYELCFVTDPGVVDPAYFRKRFDLEVTRVGSVEAGEGVWLQGASRSVTRLRRGGFDHFGGPS